MLGSLRCITQFTTACCESIIQAICNFDIIQAISEFNNGYIVNMGLICVLYKGTIIGGIWACAIMWILFHPVGEGLGKSQQPQIFICYDANSQ